LTNVEYENQIAKARRLIKKRPLEAKKILQDLYEYKPTSLAWFVARAELHLHNAEYAEVWKLLGAKEYYSKCHPDYTQPIALGYYDVLIKSYQAAGDSDNGGYFTTLRRRCANRLSSQANDDDPWVADQREELAFLEDAFLDAPDNSDAVLALTRAYYRRCMSAEAYILLTYYQSLRADHAADTLKEDLERKNFNYLYISNAMTRARSTFACVPPRDDNGGAFSVIATVLIQMGHEVNILAPYLSVELDGAVDLDETAAISLENAEERDGARFIRPFSMALPSGQEDSNIRHLLRALTQGARGETLFLLSAGGEMDFLFHDNETLQKRGARLTFFESDELESNMAFGYIGDYSAMMESVYGFNIRKAFHAPSSTQISVVLPVRNFQYTLPYTLKTCLDQTYSDYEIVLSDNSTNGNTELFEYVKELGDPRVRYVKTPAALALAKSFEYAFSQTRGEFVFALGADDALMPWGLELIADALRQHPNDDVIAWSRGFYIWPGFVNEIQEGQMNIVSPRCGKFDINYFSTKELLALVEQNAQYVYLLPLLYINSGFRRTRYTESIYAKTGALWGGNAQDVYMGALNAQLYDHIPYLRQMVTVAGMASNSIGAQASKGLYKSVPEFATSADTVFERMFPYANNDISHFFRMILRLRNAGTVSKPFIRSLDWTTILKKSMSSNVENLLYDRFCQEVSVTAKRFTHLSANSNVEAQAGEHVRLERSGLAYRETEDDQGIYINSKKLGLQNIAEAVAYMARRVEERWSE
jgi:glycosyltransferase involved in cell wall biosynthesis